MLLDRSYIFRLLKLSQITRRCIAVYNTAFAIIFLWSISRHHINYIGWTKISGTVLKRICFVVLKHFLDNFDDFCHVK